MFAVGGTVVEILLSGDLDTWAEAFALPVSAVQPLDGETEAHLGGREWNYIIDTTTLTIVWMEFGSYSDGSSTVDRGIDELLALAG